MVKFRFYDPDDKPKQPASSPHAPLGATQPSAAAPEAQTSRPQTKTAQPRASPGGFTLHWVHQLHWRQNPFTELKATPAHVYVINQDHARAQINLFFIKEKQFGTIRGTEGSGKTFMLQWLAEELQPYGDRFTVFGFEGTSSLQLVIDRIASAHAGVFAKYKGASPEDLSAFVASRAKKRIVILVDNADNIPDQVAVYYKQFLQRNNAIIIFSGTNPTTLGTDDLAVHLQQLTAHDAQRVLERRIAAVGGIGTAPFTERLVTELWKAASGNLKRFLGYCNETAMKVALKQLVLPQEPTTPEATGKTEKTVAKKKTVAKVPAKKQASPYDDLIAGLMK